MGACACTTKKKKIFSNSVKIPSQSYKVTKQNHFYSVHESSWLIILDFLKYKELFEAGKLNRSFNNIARSIPLLTKFFKNKKVNRATLQIGEIRCNHLIEPNSVFFYSRKINGEKNAEVSLEEQEKQKMFHCSDVISLNTILIKKPKESNENMNTNMNMSSLVAPNPKQDTTNANSYETESPKYHKQSFVFNVNHQQSTSATMQMPGKNTLDDSMQSDFIHSIKGIESSSDNRTPSFKEKDISSFGEANNYRCGFLPRNSLPRNGVFGASSLFIEGNRRDSINPVEHVVYNFDILSDEYKRQQKSNTGGIIRANTQYSTVENPSQKKPVLIMN